MAVLRAAGPMPELLYVADEAGSLQIGLPPGPVTIAVSPKSGGRHEVALTIADGSSGVHYIQLGRDGRFPAAANPSDEEP